MRTRTERDGIRRDIYIYLFIFKEFFQFSELNGSEMTKN